MTKGLTHDDKVADARLALGDRGSEMSYVCHATDAGRLKEI